jgi:hypothetical protein
VGAVEEKGELSEGIVSRVRLTGAIASELRCVPNWFVVRALGRRIWVAGKVSRRGV